MQIKGDGFLYLDLIIEIILSIVCGGLIGLERGYNKRPAGLRTHILVCVGSMTVMQLSGEMFEYYYTNYNYLIDPTRMSAQVVSGMGFIGAGTILKQGNSIRGITTAASIWCVAIVGLCIGAGYYEMAIFVTGILSIILILFNNFERHLRRRKNVHEIIIKLIDKDKVMGSVNFLILKYNIKIVDMNIDEPLKDSIKSNNGTALSIINLHLFIKSTNKENVKKLCNNIEELDGVMSVERL